MFGYIVSASCLLPSRRIGTDSSSVFTCCQKMDALWFTKVITFLVAESVRVGRSNRKFSWFFFYCLDLWASWQLLQSSLAAFAMLCIDREDIASAGGWPILTSENKRIPTTYNWLCFYVHLWIVMSFTAAKAFRHYPALAICCANMLALLLPLPIGTGPEHVGLQGLSDPGLGGIG